MKRILLVGPITDFSAGEKNWAAPPLGVHRIAAYLIACGHYAEVWDCNIHKDLEGKIKQGWDIIGFSSLQATIHNDIKAMWMAHELCPKALLVVGGLEATLNPMDFIDNAPINIVILAEGEEPLLYLANDMPYSSIDGIIIKKDARPVTDQKLWEYWNCIDFTRLGYQEYWKEMRAKHPTDYDAEGGDTVRVVTSTHCNRGCTFCSVTQWHKFACGRITPTAMLTAQQLYELTVRIKQQLPTTRSIYFVEDDFIQDRTRIVNYFNMIIKHGPHLRFQVQTHTSHVLGKGFEPDMELLKLLKDAGVEHITMGVENTCDHCLKSFNKPQKIDKVPAIIDACKSLGIRPYILIILFPASSTLSCLWKNYNTLSSWIQQGATISIEMHLMSYRGAPLYTSAHDMIYTSIDVGHRNRIRYPTRILPDDLEAREIQRKFNEEWPKYLEAQEVAHTFKGATGKLMVALLGELLRRNKECR